MKKCIPILLTVVLHIFSNTITAQQYTIYDKEDYRSAETDYNPNSPRVQEKIIKGGSFLCHASYCASFRISARMANSTDSTQEHLGFRTVASLEMISRNE